MTGVTCSLIWPLTALQSCALGLPSSAMPEPEMCLAGVKWALDNKLKTSFRAGGATWLEMLVSLHVAAACWVERPGLVLAKAKVRGTLAGRASPGWRLHAARRPYN